MKNIKIKVNSASYIIILTFLFTGLIKNICFIYLIIIVHELGHILMIKLFKYKIVKVEIYPMGGITTVDKKLNSRILPDLIISIFGIVFQGLLGVIFLILFKNNFINVKTYNLFLSYNKTIMLFNMLPIIPLDGYVFLKCLLEMFFSFKKSFYLSIIISIFSVILFMSFNVLLSLNNYLIISFLIYKLVIALKEFKYSYKRFLLERYLYNFKYKKIKYENKYDLNKLKKETYHYFKVNNGVLSEKQALKRIFL